MERERHDKKLKKKRTKKLIVGLCTAVVFFVLICVIGLMLLTRRPADFEMAEVDDSNQVSPYLTHKLGPELWDAVQIGEPFNLEIEEAGLNDILHRDSAVNGGWPIKMDFVKIYSPTVKFSPDRLEIFDRIGIDGINVYISIRAGVEINDEGLMRIDIEYVKAGKVDITGLARKIAAGIFDSSVSAGEELDLAEKMAYGVINNDYFLPVFMLGKYQLKIDKADIENKKLILGIMPQNMKD